MPTRAIAGGQGRVRTGRIVGPTGTPGVLIGQMIGNPLWNGAMTVIPPVALVGNMAGAGAWAGALTVGAGGGAVSPVFQTDFTAISSLPTGISLSRATGGTRFNSSGVRVTEAIDAPRFDYAWNGSVWVAKGLLIEEQRTNLLKDSGDLTTANWGVARASRATSSTLSANNSTFMTLVTASAGSSTSKEIQSAAAITITSGANYAVAFDVKKTNWNYVRVGIESDTNQSWISVIADLSTGTITETAVGSGSGTLVSSKVTALANGIFRIEFVGSIATTTAYPTCGFASAATGNSFGANFGDVGVTTVGTETLLVDAGQFEAGLFATSYIPTTSAAVTRSADIASSTDATVLSAKAWIVEIGEAQQSNPATLLGINSSVGLGKTSGNALTTGIGGTQTSGNTGTWSGTNRGGIAWDSTPRVSIALNGGTAVTAANTPITPTTLYFGNTGGSSSFMTAHLRMMGGYASLDDSTLVSKSVVGAAF